MHNDRNPIASLKNVRDMTKEESEVYEESLRKIYKPTGVNLNDLMGEKNMSDFEKFQKFFDDNNIKYKICGNNIITLDVMEVESLSDVDIDIRFWPDGSYQRFEVEVYD